MYFLCAFKLFVFVFPQACSQDDRNSMSVSGTLPYLELANNFGSAKNLLPDTAKNPFLYLEQHNYYYENHTITTEDGYILLTVRIPFGKKRPYPKKRPPVIFLHGIFCTFYDFLNAGPEQAVGFQILEAGYDVWLMNNRGNTYSKRHVSLDPEFNASKFWNFSWHEIGFYDVAANMDYIEKVTGFSKVSFVGHSQGGTVYLALAASRPEYDRRITFSVLLAPVVYLKHARQIIVRTVVDNPDIVEALVKKFDLNELLPRNEIYTQLSHLLCYVNSPFLDLCSNILQIMGGPSDQLNGTILAILSSNDPAGASVKQLRHYIQVANSNNFQLYDYGPKGNRLQYNKETPPLYNLSAITSPVAIYYGKSDFFVSTIDGARLAAQIPNVLHFVLGRDTNHMDVQWGNKALDNIFRPAIKLLNKYNRLEN